MGATEAADSSVREFSDAPSRIAKAQIRLATAARIAVASASERAYEATELTTSTCLRGRSIGIRLSFHGLDQRDCAATEGRFSTLINLPQQALVRCNKVTFVLDCQRKVHTIVSGMVEID